MPRQVPRPESSGPMEGQIRRGRRFYSPLAYTGVLVVGDWVRDDLPDLIWPALVLTESGALGARSFVRWQKAVQQDLAEEMEATTLAPLLDGRLTSLDRLRLLSEKAEQVIRERATEHGLLSISVTGAIGSYPDRPASWLFGEHVDPPTQDQLSLLARMVLETLKDGHREAVIKCLPIWSAVQAGTFKSDQEMIDILKSYPNDQATRGMADTMVRASWGAQRAASLVRDPYTLDDSVNWAKVFWGINSMTSRCIRERDFPDVEASAVSTEYKEVDAQADDADDGSNFQQFTMDLMSSYCEALESAPARLYDQERQEVHSGLVSRVSRELVTTLGFPELWSMEHSAHITRMLVETRIYLQWMATQEATIYREYQEYGAGKAKLYAGITREAAEQGASIGVDEAIQEFERLSHNEGPIDYRVVDTRDSFAGGKSIRAMADECGLKDFYRRAYSISSGVSHSEWWSIETHCMERCHNVLHRGHLIPSLSLDVGGNTALAHSWIDSAYALMRISLRILGTERSVVDSAFEWIESSTDEDPSRD